MAWSIWYLIPLQLALDQPCTTPSSAAMSLSIDINVAMARAWRRSAKATKLGQSLHVVRPSRLSCHGLTIQVVRWSAGLLGCRECSILFAILMLTRRD
ncbi:hypothetical protein SODALDRAFT_85869 [Sodiomyces alkalinus F11]|uniref:Secreted protein n=1 Tax=Sodiomyces alkalinus (strain CBS 110278 / VKM F-3762 / F11) TaxID=1314773 RepID=A0A3N2PJL5_SODAK|nr:hypothetical protein SODALDRAFT_85869 [Sodiomyces alkalinus F11]ROT34574.1 hypothetical protein SODALDRAFT_85869 [Sodiomyces alkalinus F11]